MRRNNVQPRFTVAVLSLTLFGGGAASLWAQQVNSPPVSEAMRSQMEGFERSLLGAIDSAAAKLNDRVQQAWPNVLFKLGFVATPIVNGVYLPESGAVFHVLIPGIAPLDLKMASLMAIKPRTPDGRVSNNAIVEPDPVKPEPGKPSVPPLLDPIREYTDFMRASLIDAVVDQSLALPIPVGQQLTVIADELLDGPVGPFNPRSRTLILQLKGEDLIALRENRINRDEAKNRIRISRYPN